MPLRPVHDQADVDPRWLWLAPFLVAFYNTLLDVSAVIMIAAVTDRLPLGLASRVVFAPPRPE